MIRANDDELTQAIEIALLTAKTYAIRDVFSATRALNRRVAVDTLTARIVAALRPYEVMREARETDLGEQTLPLFSRLSHRMPVSCQKRPSQISSNPCCSEWLVIACPALPSLRL